MTDGEAETPPDSGPLDLTKRDPRPPSTLTPPLSERIQTEQEKVRGILAKGLVFLVGLLSLMAFSFVPAGLMSADKLAGFFSAIIALAGTALGFYFGGRQGR